jgi:hypothetical protein
VNRKNSIVADRDGDQAAAITESFVSYARHAVANLNGGQTAAIKENLKKTFSPMLATLYLQKSLLSQRKTQ